MSDKYEGPICPATEPKADPIMRALVYRNRYGLRMAWYMFTATRAHSKAYGLTFREWFPYAWWNFLGYLRDPRQ